MRGYTDSKTNRVPSGSSRMYFAIAFDTSIRSVRRAAADERPNVSAMLGFDDDATIVVARVATSFISIEQALNSLSMEAPASRSFYDLMESARERWEHQLSVVTVDDDDSERHSTVVSSLYRLFLYPNDASENLGTVESPIWAYADVSNPPSHPRGRHKRAAPFDTDARTSTTDSGTPTARRGRHTSYSNRNGRPRCSMGSSSTSVLQDGSRGGPHREPSIAWWARAATS